MVLGKSRQPSIVPQLGWLTAHARKSLEGGIVVGNGTRMLWEGSGIFVSGVDRLIAGMTNKKFFGF